MVFMQNRIYTRKFVFNPSKARTPPVKPSLPKTPPHLRPISPQQQTVLDFARSEVSEGNPFPTMKEISWRIGNKDLAFTNYILRNLALRGFVEKLDVPIKNQNGTFARWKLLTESVKSKRHERRHPPETRP